MPLNISVRHQFRWQHKIRSRPIKM